MTDTQLTNPERWVDEYGDGLFRYAVLRLRDPEIAEDVVQETFLAALAAKERFTGQSTERTWLTGILKHKIVDHIRKASRETPLSDPVDTEETTKGFFTEKGTWRDQPADWGDDPSALLEKKEFKDILRQCLSELPGRLNDAFSLREIDGLSSKEVCKVLSVSATNLWVMLYRARMRLRKCLEMNWFEAKKARNH